MPSPQRSKQAVHTAWKATGSSFSPSSEAQSSGRLPGHAPQFTQTSSSGGRGVLGSTASVKSMQRLRQRQQLEAASRLAQQAALQVHLVTCHLPDPMQAPCVQQACSFKEQLVRLCFPKAASGAPCCERIRQHLQLRQQGHCAHQAMGRQQRLSRSMTRRRANHCDGNLSATSSCTLPRQGSA